MESTTAVKPAEYETVIRPWRSMRQLRTREQDVLPLLGRLCQRPPQTPTSARLPGMPGVLPNINRQAVEFRHDDGARPQLQGIGLHKFDRKNYPYPDLMKGYQISQYDQPVGTGGWLNIEVNGEVKRIASPACTRKRTSHQAAAPRRRRLRLQPGRRQPLRHASHGNRVGARHALGRGSPRLPGQAAFHPALPGRLHGQHGRGQLPPAMPTSASAPRGAKNCWPGGSQNMNSFAAVFRALEYEAPGRGKVLSEGGHIPQETRAGWRRREKRSRSAARSSPTTTATSPRPDLPPSCLPESGWRTSAARLPELPEARHVALMSDFGLPAYDAGLLTEDLRHGRLLRNRCVLRRPRPLPQGNGELADGPGLRYPQYLGDVIL